MALKSHIFIALLLVMFTLTNTSFASRHHGGKGSHRHAQRASSKHKKSARSHHERRSFRQGKSRGTI